MSSSRAKGLNPYTPSCCLHFLSLQQWNYLHFAFQTAHFRTQNCDLYVTNTRTIPVYVAPAWEWHTDCYQPCLLHDFVKRGTPRRGPPCRIMRPTATFVDYVYTINISTVIQTVRYSIHCYFATASREPVHNVINSLDTCGVKVKVTLVT
jgi:hypothetical protein